MRTVRFLKIRVKSDKLHDQNLVSFKNLVSPETEGHRLPGDSWISHQCLLSTWLELWPLTTVFSGPIKRVWLSLHNVWKRKEKKKKAFFFFFTHQQAVVFRFQMPLPAHRKHCPCVSHHSMKSPLPSGGRMKPSGKSCSQLFPATPSLHRALQSRSHVPPPLPAASHTSRSNKRYPQGPSASRHQALHLRRCCIVLLAALGAGGGT